jgi:chromosome partitioning protein
MSDVSTPAHRANIIVIVNNKGGVGKTNLATNLAVAMGSRKHRVGFLDLDPQADATEIFLPETLIDPETNNLPKLISALLDGEQPDLNQYIYPTRYSGVSVLPNHEDSAWLEPDLYTKIRPGKRHNYTLLRDNILGYLEHSFDTVVIDLPPNMGVYVNMGLMLAHFAIVPVTAGSKRSQKGLIRAINTIADIRDTSNPDLRFLRLIFNAVDKRTLACRQLMENLKRSFGQENICKTTIPKNTVLEQAETVNESVLSFAKNSTSAVAFRSLAKEVKSIIASE